MKNLVFISAATLLACSQASSKPSTTRDAGGATAQGGTTNPCKGVKLEPVAWDADTPLGVSAQQQFAPLIGECHSTLRWDTHGWSGTQSGQTAVTVKLEIDPMSVRVEQPQNAAPSCHPSLLADAHVELSTEDGSFADSADVTLRYSTAGVFSFGFVRDLSDSAGSFTLDLKPGQAAQLHYRFDGAQAGCAGEISLTITSTSGQMGMGAVGPLASWSSSGCPLGHSAVRVEQASTGGGPSLLEKITQSWGDVTYSGVWDDGKATSLRLSVKAPDASACADSGNKAITIPVRVDYGTEDGRVVSHQVDAEIRAVSPNGGPAESLDLWIDDTLECADATDTLAYTRASCMDLRAVEAQLGINLAAGTLSFSDSGLLVYEYDRASKAAAGAADRVRKLTLSE